MSRKHRNKGFSLIELLVSLAIFSFLMTAVYSSFSQGLKLWSFAIRERPDWKIDIFMEKFSDDIRNSFRFDQSSFIGTKDAVQFYTLASGAPASVRYFLDKEDHTIHREMRSYEKILDRKPDLTHAALVLENVEDLQFEYYRYDSETQVKTWKAKWSEDCLPKTVKVSLTYKGSVQKSFARFINAPASNGCREIR